MVGEATIVQLCLIYQNFPGIQVFDIHIQWKVVYQCSEQLPFFIDLTFFMNEFCNVLGSGP